MLCITDAYAGMMNVNQAQFASKYVDHGFLLDGFCKHLLPSIGSVFQARTSVHTILFVALFQHFLHLHLSSTPQTFEAFGKLVETGEYPIFVACQPQV